MKKKSEKKKKLNMHIYSQNAGVLFLFLELTLGPKIKAYFPPKILGLDSLYTAINTITSNHITDSRPYSPSAHPGVPG